MIYSIVSCGEPVGQMSPGFKSLIVVFVRYLKTQWDMVFRHLCCSQNILDKRNSSPSGARKCLGAIVCHLQQYFFFSVCACKCACNRTIPKCTVNMFSGVKVWFRKLTYTANEPEHRLQQR